MRPYEYVTYEVCATWVFCIEPIRMLKATQRISKPSICHFQGQWGRLRDFFEALCRAGLLLEII